MAHPAGATSGVHHEHAFTRVDETARPRDWIACLDRFSAEPFYREYKQRVRALLDPQPSELHLDVGSGVGSEAMAVAGRAIGVDVSLEMCREARARGLAMAVAADAEALPLRSGLVDGCWSDRTFQHLARPERALREIVRVVKPGGTIVVVDPDYGTQTLDFPDPPLARKVLDFRAHHLLRNGTLAHDMARLFAATGVDDVRVERRTLTVRDPRSLDNVLGLRSWARTALSRGLMTQDEVSRWETLFDGVAGSGAFRWSVAFFITSGRAPARGAG